MIALDPALTSTGRQPILDLASSGTLKAELLVGESGAKAITKARARRWRTRARHPGPERAGSNEPRAPECWLESTPRARAELTKARKDAGSAACG